MDYKEKYEQGLECIQEILNGTDDEEIRTSTLFKKLQPFFPELAENEEERIRKETISLVRYTKGRRIGYEPRIGQDKMIAWLEKQDEQKSVDEVLKIRQELYQSGYNDGYKHGQEDKEKELHGKLLEKQGEQKSTDKAEPKFKAGDWL